MSRRPLQHPIGRLAKAQNRMSPGGLLWSEAPIPRMFRPVVPMVGEEPEVVEPPPYIGINYHSRPTVTEGTVLPTNVRILSSSDVVAGARPLAGDLVVSLAGTYAGHGAVSWTPPAGWTVLGSGVVGSGPTPGPFPGGTTSGAGAMSWVAAFGILTTAALSTHIVWGITGGSSAAAMGWFFRPASGTPTAALVGSVTSASVSLPTPGGGGWGAMVQTAYGLAPSYTDVPLGILAGYSQVQTGPGGGTADYWANRLLLAGSPAGAGAIAGPVGLSRGDIPSFLFQFGWA